MRTAEGLETKAGLGTGGGDEFWAAGLGWAGIAAESCAGLSHVVVPPRLTEPDFTRQ